MRLNIIKFLLHCQILRFLYQTLCVFLQIKDRKHIEQNFHSFAGATGQNLAWVGLPIARGKLVCEFNFHNLPCCLYKQSTVSISVVCKKLTVKLSQVKTSLIGKECK